MRNLDRQTSSSSLTPSSPTRFQINDRPLKRTLLDFTNLSLSDSGFGNEGYEKLSDNVELEVNERPLKRPLVDFGNLSISDSSQNVGADSEINMAKNSPAAPPLKHVFVRVKRKPFQSPLDAFLLEIRERPLKHPLVDFGNLSIANSSQNMEFHNKKVLVQHVKTISSSEVTLDTVGSFLEPWSRSASESKAKVEERKNFKKINSSAIDAHFKQIWKTADEKELRKICQFYDIVRVEEKIKEVQQEDISLEDQKLFANFIPLLIDVIPKAAAEIEAGTSVHSEQEDYVYDLYTVMDEVIAEEESSCCYPLVQVDDEHLYDGPDDLDYETDISNAVDYLAMLSEEAGSECEPEEIKHGSSCNEFKENMSEFLEEGFECESEESMHDSYCNESDLSTPKFSEEEGSESESEGSTPKFSEEGSESESEEKKHGSSK